ncbi:hypothetical protein BGZ94_008858 [Podila epigama]|nr:hypothetical protein BGZ94_008858 [Podila epigama]
MLARTHICAGASMRIRTIAVASRQQYGQHAFSTASPCFEEQQTSAPAPAATTDAQEASTNKSEPKSFNSPRYLKELENRKRGDSNSRSFERRGNRRSEGSENDSPAPKFKAQPTIPYDTTTDLQFADQVNWEVTSVFEPRTLFANAASGQSSVPRIGTAAVNNASNTGYTHSFDISTSTLPGPAFSIETVGVRAHGELDPEVEQSLIKELGSIHLNKDKDHRKVKDVSPTHQKMAFYLSHNYQETLNPRNEINRYNNGNVKHMASVKYDFGSDEVGGVAAGDKQAEKSWKRLERLGGDYTRPNDPLSLLSTKPKAGKEGSSLLASISPLIGHNQSIGLEDKKKMLRALEKGLGDY